MTLLLIVTYVLSKSKLMFLNSPSSLKHRGVTRFVNFLSLGNLNTICPQTPYFLCFKDTLVEEINEEM